MKMHIQKPFDNRTRDFDSETNILDKHFSKHK